MPNVDIASHEPWLESKRRSRARRKAARQERRSNRTRRTAAVVAALSLTVTAGGAVAAGGGGSASVRAAGSSVTALQSALGIPADGIYGPQTRRAVRRFQRAHGLAVDGIAGPATLGALGLSGSTVKQNTSSSSGSGTAPSAALAAIAQCESGGDPTAISPGGQYRGKYQFSRATWRDLGGTGDPAAAPESVQDAMAAKLYAARGTAPWPVCGKNV